MAARDTDGSEEDPGDSLLRLREHTDVCPTRFLLRSTCYEALAFQCSGGAVMGEAERTRGRKVMQWVARQVGEEGPAGGIPGDLLEAFPSPAVPVPL